MGASNSVSGSDSITERSSGVLIYRLRNGRREYLFLKRSQGFLDNTKGHIEAGENEIQAAIRETMEECGLSPTLHEGFKWNMEYKYRRNGEEVRKRVSMFLGEVPENSSVRISSEHTGSVWLTYEEALKSLSFENQKELVIQAESFLSGMDFQGKEAGRKE